MFFVINLRQLLLLLGVGVLLIVAMVYAQLIAAYGALALLMFVFTFQILALPRRAQRLSGRPSTPTGPIGVAFLMPFAAFIILWIISPVFRDAFGTWSTRALAWSVAFGIAVFAATTFHVGRSTGTALAIASSIAVALDQLFLRTLIVNAASGFMGHGGQGYLFGQLAADVLLSLLLIVAWSKALQPAMEPVDALYASILGGASHVLAAQGAESLMLTWIMTGQGDAPELLMLGFQGFLMGLLPSVGLLNRSLT